MEACESRHKSYNAALNRGSRADRLRYHERYRWRSIELSGSIPGHSALTQRPWASRLHATASVHHAVDLGTNQRRWRSNAGEITAGFAESNGSLLRVNDWRRDFFTRDTDGAEWPHNLWQTDRLTDSSVHDWCHLLAVLSSNPEISTGPQTVAEELYLPFCMFVYHCFMRA